MLFETTRGLGKTVFSDPTTGLYDPAKARQQFAQLKQNTSSETALK